MDICFLFNRLMKLNVSCSNVETMFKKRCATADGHLFFLKLQTGNRLYECLNLCTTMKHLGTTALNKKDSIAD